MNGQFSLIPEEIAQKLAVAEIIGCNQTTMRYGLVLRESDAVELAATRSEVLEKVERIEFSGGVINKLITEFCDSPYLTQSNYAETLNELVEAFYYFKNETLDELDDDELIAFMKKAFDQSCQGSMDLLQTRDLEIMARRIRFGNTDPDELYNILETLSEENADYSNWPDDENSDWPNDEDIEDNEWVEY